MSKERNYLFDNYKVFLIYLVVVGHFVTPSYQDSDFLCAVKWFIFAFHMPAFMFASGYFSKKKKSFISLIEKLLIPYLVFELLYYLLYTFILGDDTELALMYPKFTLWYILSIFFYKIITPYFTKIPGYIAVAIVMGIAAGFTPLPGGLLTHARALYFFPFFLLGVRMNENHINLLRRHAVQIISGIIIVCFLIYLAIGNYSDLYPVSITYGRYSYEVLNQSPMEGIIVRLICYATGFILTLAFLSVMPSRKTGISFIGPRTLSVYIFHGLFFKWIEESSTILNNINTLPEEILLLVFCGAVTYIFALRPFNEFTSLVSSVPLSGIIKKLKGE